MKLRIWLFKFHVIIFQACGFEYTSKLQRMFQDIGVSKDLNEQFRRHLNETLSNEPLDIDFQIQVKSVSYTHGLLSGYFLYPNLLG